MRKSRKYNQQQLLDNYAHVTNGLYLVSKIKGEEIEWDFREYDDYGHPNANHTACDAKNADIIVLTNTRYYIDINQDELKAHHNFNKIEKDTELASLG